MATIKLMRDPGFAPNGFILARQRSDGSFYTRDEDNVVVVDNDMDWPCVAWAFGGDFAEEQIEEAETWLLENLGTCTDDPGYFYMVAVA